MKRIKFFSLFLAFCMLLVQSPRVFAVSPEQTYSTIMVRGNSASSEIAAVSDAASELSVAALNLYTPDDVENLDLVLESNLSRNFSTKENEFKLITHIDMVNAMYRPVICGF